VSLFLNSVVICEHKILFLAIPFGQDYNAATFRKERYIGRVAQRL
jgi:hypothetical protein